MQPDEQTYTLTTGERLSPLWSKLSTYLQTHLAALREQNDGPLPEDARNRLVGRIEEVKSMLRLQEDVLIVPGPPKMVYGEPERQMTQDWARRA